MGSQWLRGPLPIVQESRLLLDYQQQKLSHGLHRSLSGQRKRFGELASALDALSPLKVLGRGYSVIQDKEGAVLASVDQMEIGQEVELRLADGRATCRVEGKERG